MYCALETTAMPIPGDRIRACWPGLLLLLVSGCGVGAYESKMLDAQARVKRFEEESTLLEKDPLVIPQVEKKEDGKDPVKVPIANVYLRPPLGINSKAVNETDPRNGLLFTYDPRQPKAAGPVTRVELALGDQKEFVAEVLRTFGAPDKPAFRPRPFPGATPESVTTFETLELDDGTYVYSINIWRGQRIQAAVVYWMGREQRGLAAKAVEVSLGTFAVDEEADRRRALQGKASFQPPGHK
jgi:hypothetical protein